MKTPIQKLNYLFDKYNHLTEGSFHNSLWQILINGRENGWDSGKTFAFTHILGPVRTWNVGIVTKGQVGYTPATFGIKADAPEEEVRGFINEMNSVIFGITEEHADLIVMRSMDEPKIPSDNETNE